MKTFLLVMLFGLSSLARLTDEQAVIKIEKDKIIIQTKKGYHLNKDAPASATFDNLEALFKPTVKTEKLFAFKKDQKAKAGTVSFYVCDDKKTVCEQHQKKLDFTTGEINKFQEKQTKETEKNNNLVSTNGKPTLLVFSAPWCPACIRMQTECYTNTKVKKQINKLNFLKLNSDLVENYELAEKFKIKAIPTLIMLDINGNETFRWLDFQEPKDFSKSLAKEIEKVNLADTILKNAQLGDPEAASNLAFKAFNSLDYAEAVKWFNLTKSKKDQKFKLAAEVMLAQEKAEQNEKLTEEYTQTLQKVIELTTSQLDKLRWTIDFLEKKKELKLLDEDLSAKSKTLFSDLDKLIQNQSLAGNEFNNSTYGNYAGFEKEELLWLKSRLLGILDMKDEKSKTDKETIANIRKKKLSSSKPGEILLAIAYLREAGDIQFVTELYETLIKKYNASYVYFEKYARFSQKNKNFEKALKLTESALSFPEGNELQLNLLKAQILKDLNKKAEATATIDLALKAENVTHKKFARTVKRLNELKEELNKEGK